MVDDVSDKSEGRTLMDPEHKHLVASLAILLIAAVVRVVFLIMTVDLPGDGPTRAVAAYEWARSPRWISHGMWPPAIEYLGGAASLIIPSPALAVRVLNAILGSLTAPVMFAIARRTYGAPTAWLAGLSVALFPLHVGLSTSSLSDASFVFWMLLAVFALVRVLTENTSIHLLTVTLLVALILAQMTRYEAWVLTPIMLVFIVLRYRSLRWVVSATAILVAFPLLWSIGNAVHSGDPLLGFSAARGSAVRSFGNEFFGVVDSITQLGRAAVDHLTVPLVLAIAAGFFMEIRLLLRRELTRPRLLLLALTAGFWSFALGLTILRGPTLYNRFLVLGFLVAIPFAGVAITAIARGRTNRWLLAISMVLASGIVSARGIPRGPLLWVTPDRPTSVNALTLWIQRAGYANQPILLTEMGWRSTYFPQYAPTLQWEIFAHRHSDAAIRERLGGVTDSVVLITRAGDEQLLVRMQHLASSLATLRRVHELDGFVVLASGGR